MNIFITGSTGFIGNHLLALLVSKKCNILALSRNEAEIENIAQNENLKYITGSVENIDSWKDDFINFKPDALIHLAWDGIPDYSEEISQKNLKISKALIDFAYQNGCKKVLCSGSCWEYGQFQGELSEDSQLIEYNPFSKAKNEISKYGFTLAKKYQSIFLWTRIFYVYGPGQRSKSLIPYIINSIIDDNIPQINNPFNCNDFIFVEDVVEAIYLLITQSTKSDIFNIGSGYSTSVADIVKKVLELSETILSYQLPKQVNDYSNFYANIDKIKSSLSWQPTFDIEKGMKKTIEFYNLSRDIK